MRRVPLAHQLPCLWNIIIIIHASAHQIKRYCNKLARKWSLPFILQIPNENQIIVRQACRYKIRSSRKYLPRRCIFDAMNFTPRGAPHVGMSLRVLWLISKLMVITQVCRYCDFHFDPRVPPFSTRVYTPHPSKSDGHCRSNVPKNNVYALSCCSTLQTFRTIEIMRCWFFDSIPLRNYFFKKIVIQDIHILSFFFW